MTGTLLEAYFAAFFTAAHRFLCAAAIRALPSGIILCPFGLPLRRFGPVVVSNDRA